MREEGQKINASIAENYEDTLGINSREQLANAEKILRQRKNKQLMAQGVTLMDPATTYIDYDVEIGQDTVIYPSTWIEGNSKIGGNCKIGPNSRLNNVVIGDNVEAMFVFAEDCEVADDVKWDHMYIFVQILKFVIKLKSAISLKSKIQQLAKVLNYHISSISVILIWAQV